MKYFAHIDSKNELSDIDSSKIIEDKYSSNNVKNLEVTEEIYLNKEKYIYLNGEIVLNPNYEKERLAKLKQEKYKEALMGANNFLTEGLALYELNENTHIEATDGNIGKLTAYALAYLTGELKEDDTVFWTTKEDKTIEISKDEISKILKGLGEKQAEVWNSKFTNYINQIEAAKTVEEVNAIEVNYDGK